ncbi:DUF5667 domain-containing protein [Kribbella sp. CA-293567]|uniref:DUF5667 domain-containing protein n=1 Tax=Kribbella sp. CA-293567 TaxID=3002436 RepID=UPI0022DE11B2|nr:DUF5667 domain-containing protein [Kribbella sp. CA-293567]WBQ06169.1 DUF5667 domain-containing protein [Kribbella sp. CA-293567]
MEAVELVGRLRTAGAVTPRPEFAAELRHRLLEQAAARAATTTPTVVPSVPDSSDDPPPREDDDASVTDIRHRHGRRIRLVASTAALVLLGGGIGSAAAAQQAMPGDALYGMKRGIENVSTNVAVGDGSRGRRELGHAETRLSEIRALVKNGGDVATIDSTLADFTVQSRTGITRLIASYVQDGDPASITAVTAFITSARQAIGELAPKLPPESLKGAVEALATIEDLARQSAAACPKCEKPKPAKNAGPAPAINPGTEPSTPIKAPTSSPTRKPSAEASTVPSAKPSSPVVSQAPPSETVDTTIVEQPTTLPTDLKTPPRPSSKPSTTPSGPSVPTLPTPGTPSWPWPFPSLSLPLPTINLPGVLETLLPPWK